VKCPKCGSEAKKVKYLGTDCIICSCGYDERDKYDMVSGQRTSQKEKARFNPYKAGGSKRTK